MTTIADKLREVRNILATLTLSTDMPVSELAKEALAELPDAEEMNKLDHLLQSAGGYVSKSSELEKQRDELVKTIINYGGHLKTCQGRSAESCDCWWIDRLRAVQRIEASS